MGRGPISPGSGEQRDVPRSPPVQGPALPAATQRGAARALAALQEEQAVRRWQHFSQGDNKSYQCKPIPRQQDNPRDKPPDNICTMSVLWIYR